MQKVKQVVRLYGQGKGTKAISSSLAIARNTIKKYLQIFHSSGIDYETFFKMSDSDLAAMFHVSTSQTPKSDRLIELESMLPYITKQLKRKGVTREQLHKEYLAKYPDGYARSRFNNFIFLYIGQTHPTMHIEHKVIEDDMIEKFAKVLGVAPQLIKDLEEDPVTVIIENNKLDNNSGSAYSYIAGDSVINNPVDKIAELFERLLEKEQEKIALLEKLLKERK